MSPSPTRQPFRVLPPGEPPTGPHDLVLEGSAFGSGTHPTSLACLELLAERAPLSGLHVLDLGSGSGLLGLAALRLGAARALCLDVNPDAVASARRNGLANGLDGRVEHRCGGPDDLAGARFDLVIANVGGDLLLDRAELVTSLARPGGTLILSGLLAGWAPDLESAYAGRGCRVLARREAGAFCVLLLERPQAGRAA